MIGHKKTMDNKNQTVAQSGWQVPIIMYPKERAPRRNGAPLTRVGEALDAAVHHCNIVNLAGTDTRTVAHSLSSLISWWATGYKVYFFGATGYSSFLWKRSQSPVDMLEYRDTYGQAQVCSKGHQRRPLDSDSAPLSAINTVANRWNPL